MKVILTQDVEKLGHSLDIVEVADGYARNFLMPRSLAMPATKSSLANLETLKKHDERKQSKLRVAAQEVADKIGATTLDFADANVGSGGKLYGSFGNADIAAKLQSQFGVEVDRRSILIPEPIRAEGFYNIPLRLHRDITVNLNIKVGNPTEAPAPVALAPETQQTTTQQPVEAVAAA
jgi:large subunit ribosomal protein L9